MKIEKLNTDKIRIVLNIEDLKKNNIDFNSFMTNSKENQNFFLHILDLAEKQVGFFTDNYEISIETMYIENKFFVLNITRYKENLNYTPRVHAQKKDISKNGFPNIFEFSSIDSFLDFYNGIKQISSEFSFNNLDYSLYILNNNYYLLLNYQSISNQKNLLYLISEFSINSFSSNNLLIKLQESGKCIKSNTFN